MEVQKVPLLVCEVMGGIILQNVYLNNIFTTYCPIPNILTQTCPTLLVTKAVSGTKTHSWSDEWLQLTHQICGMGSSLSTCGKNDGKSGFTLYG